MSTVRCSNISACWFGLPLFVSNPHFTIADTYFISKVDGLKSDEKMYTTTVILEPRTGLMLELRAKFQLNFYIEPRSHIRSYQTKRRMLFPVFWLDMLYMRTKNSIQLLQIVYKLEKYCHIFGASIIALSLLIFIWRAFKYYFHHMEINSIANDDDDYVIADSNDKEKVALYSLPTNFNSLLYISYPRRSLQIIFAHLDKDEALSSFLEENQRYDFEKELQLSVKSRVDHKFCKLK
ncbi:protein croquemort-like [Lucilia sericata]|uniref:protein croquemort-like n=1 Tax=Lucilia sericata TaxID=13632 RepID=UPI0018A841F3|nr:protein croquemort-like [Lucilia sericata]